MEIVLNGESRIVPDGHTLVELLDRRKPRPPFAVEVNKRHIRRGEYDQIQLRERDQVEIVTLVGGG